MSKLKQKIKKIILDSPNISHQSLIGMFIKDPKAVEACAIINHIFAEEPNQMAIEVRNNKTREKIDYLIEEYGEDPELADLFISDSILSAIVYREKKLIQQAKKIVENLIQDKDTYTEKVFEYKNPLFQYPLSVKINPHNFEEIDLAFLNEKIIAEAITCSNSDDKSVEMFNNFLFYQMRYFSLILDPEQINNYFLSLEEMSVDQINKKKKFRINLLGDLSSRGMEFKIDLNSLKNQIEGIYLIKMEVRKDVLKILKDTGSDLIKDETKDALIDYFASYFPGIKEIKLAQKIILSLSSNIFEKTSINNVIKDISNHKRRLEKMNLTIRDYYINIYLTEEFQKFFKENNLDFNPNDLELVFNKLYINYMQSINNLLTPELEDLIAQKKIKTDIDTYKFTLVCNSLFDPDQPIKKKLLK